MKKKKPTSVKGTRDLGVTQIVRRSYILEILKPIYAKYGFAPLETPALEHLETLMGKYGPEGDQLLFKVLRSGDFLAGVTARTLDHKALLPQIAEKGLRYDLTVPLMRHIAMNAGQLVFPFKRYQIQPVWRADRPQKERYREFYQCDVDVVGTSSLLCEADILVMIHEVLQQLGVRDFTIHLNHRGILKGIATLVDMPNQEEVLCTSLDKLDKLGKDRVLEELREKGIKPDSLKKLLCLFDLPIGYTNQLTTLTKQLAPSQEGTQGLQALKQILTYVNTLQIDNPAIKLDPTLARGLSYYTGAIFEVKVKHETWGSIGGGGRYDELAEIFGLSGLPGVGFSFGLDRLYAVLEAQSLFPDQLGLTTQVILTNLSPSLALRSLQVLALLRANHVRAEMYPEAEKLKKQLQYAHRRNVPFVAIIGEDEQATQAVTLRDMKSGAQQSLTPEQLVKTVSQHLSTPQ